MGRRPIYQTSRRQSSLYPVNKASVWVGIILWFSLLFFAGFGAILFTSNRWTVGGVPAPIIVSFLRDAPARNAYFHGDRQKLHDRLKAMDTEARIKAFYRSQFQDEAKLDQYIHQILYDRTGYVGVDYQVAQGILIKKKLVPDNFENWFKLARAVGLVSGTLNQNGIQYVTTPKGGVVPDEELAAIFSQAELQNLQNARRSLP